MPKDHDPFTMWLSIIHSHDVLKQVERLSEKELAYLLRKEYSTTNHSTVTCQTCLEYIHA